MELEGHHQSTTNTAADPEVDRRFELQPTWRQYEVAGVFNAKGRGLPGRGSEAGSVAGTEATELSEAATEMPEVAGDSSWLRKMAAKYGLEGARDVTQMVACEHPPLCKCAWSMPRCMDTHRPARVGGGYRPPQDRPPPVAGS